MSHIFNFELPKRKFGYALRPKELSLEVLAITYTPFQVSRYYTRNRGTGGWPRLAQLFYGGVVNEK